jgi:tetratricopeptide (TPR) repeat protein
MNRDLSEFRSRVWEAYERRHYRRAALIAREGVRIAVQQQDEAGEIRFRWIEGALQVIQGCYEAAFACYSNTVALIERARLDLRDPEVADLAARAYGDWANAAALLPNGPPEGIRDVLERQTAFINGRGLREMTCEMYHARSICLARLGDHQGALQAAEEGIALRRANPEWPGCRLDHHLQIYAERLVDQKRWDDAAAVVSEGMDLYGSAGYWDLRGRMRLEQGDIDCAIADLEEAAARDSDSDSLRMLGIALLLRGDRERAFDRFRGARAARPQEVENSLWMAAASGETYMLGAEFERAGFERQVVEFYLGRIPARELIERAGNAPSPFTRRAWLSTAHGFAGVWNEFRGDRSAAVDHYKSCRDAAVPGCQLGIWAARRLDG